MSWRDFFYFTRTERQGIIVLIALIVLVLTACWFIPAKKSNLDKDTTFKKEYAAFMASLQERNQRRKANHTKRFAPTQVVLAPFDPNTIDSVGLLKLGLPSWVAKNILRYRAKGGRFHKPEDFKKMYGIEAHYATLLPYIAINETFTRKDTIRLYTQQEKKDSLTNYKYPAGTMLSLNRADTTELKKIPGIGSGIARMIVGYRKQLGGYCKIEQLAELNLAVDKLRPWFSVDTNEVQQVNLNRASVERLKNHPYFSFYQAKIIFEYRKKNGKLHSLQQLKLYEEFTPEDLERIAPYVCFE